MYIVIITILYQGNYIVIASRYSETVASEFMDNIKYVYPVLHV